jgi:hypothetical protein
MFPREIISTSFWIRHELPFSSPLPESLTEDLRKEIPSRNVQLSDEMVQEYVRNERVRLDLKWCLDQYFGWNVSDLIPGQLVTVNVSGFVHMAYVIGITPMKITITPADRLGTLYAIGSDDIYSAEYNPSYESFLINHTVLHPQHVLDYVKNQNKQRSIIFNDVSCGTSIEQSPPENFELEWPDGIESWCFHDIKPQRELFVKRIIAPIDIPDSASDERAQCVPIVPFTTYPLRVSQPILQKNIVSPAPNFEQHRYQSVKNNHIHPVFCISRTFLFVPSRKNYRHKFLRLLGSHLAFLWPILLSTLAWLGLSQHPGYSPVHRDGHSQTSRLTVVVDLVPSTYLQYSLTLFTPHTKTIETLRALESLLIYAVT